MSKRITRRKFLIASAALSPAAIIAACAPGADSLTEAPPIEASSTTEVTDEAAPPTAEIAETEPTEDVQVLQPTPACADEDDETPEQMEGPFFTPNSPERPSLLEEGIEGTRIVVTGHVLTTGCQPVAGALLDFWHADNDGVYDNAGYKLRGHQFADENGRFSLESIVPGLYPGRTRHFHVKVQAPNQPVLTTQLYFPNEPDNATDGIFHPDLLMDVQDDNAGGKVAVFDFVLDTG